MDETGLTATIGMIIALKSITSVFVQQCFFMEG